jgi:hypothetical protein
MVEGRWLVLSLLLVAWRIYSLFVWRFFIFLSQNPNSFLREFTGVLQMAMTGDMAMGTWQRMDEE